MGRYSRGGAAYGVIGAGGVGQIERIRLIRAVFDLSLVEAKAVLVAVRTGMSLAESQGRFVEDLSNVFDSEA